MCDRPQRAILAAMATRTAPSRRELELLVGEYRHLRSEHERAGEGSRARRRLGERLLEVRRRLDRLLEVWVAEEQTREAWREHLHHGGRAPAEPGDSPPALVFRGRSRAGSAAEVRERPDGDFDVRVDGGLVERAELGDDLAQELPCTLRLDGLEFREVFAAPAEALAAAEEFFAAPAGPPPWKHARELVADGIVDTTFALTPRGRRALARSARR
jgi:hypothetical protein